ncbi:hypothetical protein BJY21_002642 [Kineosphaera limosa]|uniref:Uncharacterized protein n=1 Tax=Kineosphaera limosa NBRC 100340 TaxID=1184609 RepID=K6X8Q9_9MICO|nr:hypothetical protein [Kineosphaera limosa]NYE01458.1 hypothetical protein [Kineosphaera limosa]GAB95204.1 hypothetical protein KILIM_017_00490 [Kineosphaera limosa NBRC 100340]
MSAATLPAMATAAAPVVSRFGLASPRPRGWSVDIRRLEPDGLRVASVEGNSLLGSTGEILRPVLHASTAALPDDRGDFGSGAVQLLGSADVFFALVDYGPEVADTGLFAANGIPRLAPSQFSQNNLQRPQARVSAAQHFFSSGGRGFCLFVVIGAHRRRMATVPLAASMTARVRITPYALMSR